jgi:hypothetical protein
VRFLYSGIVNIALLGLSTLNLSAIAATPPTAVTQATTIDRIAIYDSSLTTIRGNGVEFKLPAGFKGGSPSSAQTRATIAQTTKMFPSMASLMQVFESDPSIVRAIATSTDSQVPSMVLVTRLPIPASVSLAEIQEMMAKVMPSMLPPEFTLVDNQILNVGSRQIVRLSIDVNVQGIKLKESIGLFKRGNQIFQVTYVYDNESSPQAMPVFEQIINTFKATSKT